jgi:hypothetical protein
MAEVCSAFYGACHEKLTAALFQALVPIPKKVPLTRDFFNVGVILQV